MKRYITWEVKRENNDGELSTKEYKLKLGIQQTIDLEEKLGKNPMLCLINFIDGATMLESNGMFDPIKIFGISQKEIYTILHYSLLKYQPKLKMEDTLAIIEDYYDDEDEPHTLYDIIGLVSDVLDMSGLIPKQDEEEGKEERKN